MDETIGGLLARARGMIPGNPATALEAQVRELQSLGETVVMALVAVAVVWVLFHLYQAISAWRWKRSVKGNLEAIAKMQKEHLALAERQTKALEAIAAALAGRASTPAGSPPAVTKEPASTPVSEKRNAA